MIFPFPYIKTNSANDIEVVSPPDDTVTALEFSPTTCQRPEVYLIAGSCDRTVRCWEVEETEQSMKTVPKAMKVLGGPVTDVAWNEDGNQVFMSSTDHTAHLWDLASNQMVQVAQHEAPITTCHVINAANYKCLMTGSMDRTIKFWDARTAVPMAVINLPERCCCAALEYPMAVVGTADGSLIIYNVENGPVEYTRQKSPLDYIHRSIAIFKDNDEIPNGYAVSNTEGLVAIQYVNPWEEKNNYTFMCNREKKSSPPNDFYPVNSMAYHPVHGTLVTVGSDGIYNYWDTDAHIGVKYSDTMDQPITKCALCTEGQLLALAIGNDGLKPFMYGCPGPKPRIFLHPCYEDMR